MRKLRLPQLGSAVTKFFESCLILVVLTLSSAAIMSLTESEKYVLPAAFALAIVFSLAIAHARLNPRSDKIDTQEELEELADRVYEKASINYAGMQGFVKRASDVFVAALFLMLMFPVLMTIAVILKRRNHAPTLSKHKRFAWGGRVVMKTQFNLAPKVRSQASDEKDSLNSFEEFLRRSALNELPSYFDLLAGRVSLIGPTLWTKSPPPGGAIEKVIGSVRPGIIGVASAISTVRGRDISLTHAKLWEANYVAHWSLLADLKVLGWLIMSILSIPGGPPDANAFGSDAAAGKQASGFGVSGNFSRVPTTSH